MIVHIPPTPALLLKLIDDFSKLRAAAEAHDYFWPESLDEWSAFLERSSEAVA